MCTLILLVAVCSTSAFAEEPTSPDPATPVPIEDLREEFLSWRFGMFIHFNMATFANRQWAQGYEDPAIFRPDQLDCEQWARAAKSAGMKYMVLTVKHTGGWCLWPSEHTDSHDMGAFVNYKDGKGDIVKEFVEACRKHDLKVGLYYCLPRDFRRTNEDKQRSPLRGLPPEAKGQPVAFIKKQMTELLTNYGPIDLLWFDQYQFDIREQWPEILAHVKSIQPNCVVIANNSVDLELTDIHSYEYPWLKGKPKSYFRENNRTALPPEDNAIAAEVCDNLCPAWFWTPDRKWELRDAQAAVDMLRLCNSRRANYLLNVVPDRSGLIPDTSVARLEEIGRLLGSESD